VCRCRRAWLPPSDLWLFPPRDPTHDIGGWYIEWGGHGLEARPGWLDPAVFLLTAAFDTLEYEVKPGRPGGCAGVCVCLLSWGAARHRLFKCRPRGGK
jgi:hypothetical protein